MSESLVSEIAPVFTNREREETQTLGRDRQTESEGQTDGQRVRE